METSFSSKNNAKYLRSAIGKIGYNIGDNETQIIPLVAGPEHMTMILRDQLETYDIFGSPFCDPATPKNRSLIRLTIAVLKNRMLLIVSYCGGAIRNIFSTKFSLLICFIV